MDLDDVGSQSKDTDYFREKVSGREGAKRQADETQRPKGLIKKTIGEMQNADFV